MVTADTIIVSYDNSNGKDHTVLVVGRKRANQSVEIINALRGDEAEEMYRRLTTGDLAMRLKTDNLGGK